MITWKQLLREIHEKENNDVRKALDIRDLNEEEEDTNIK